MFKMLIKKVQYQRIIIQILNSNNGKSILKRKKYKHITAAAESTLLTDVCLALKLGDCLYIYYYYVSYGCTIHSLALYARQL